MNVSVQSKPQENNSQSSRLLHQAFVPDYASVGLVVDRWSDAIDAVAANLGSALGNAGIKLKVVSTNDLCQPIEEQSDIVGLILAVHDETPENYIRAFTEHLHDTAVPNCGLLSCIDASGSGKRADIMRSIESQLFARLQQWQWVGMPEDTRKQSELNRWLRSLSIQCRNRVHPHHFAM